jgi:nucleotide-binding universal stress UspA family protein
MSAESFTFSHLLIPLDGSHLAEVAVPVAAVLAQSLNAAVTLFHVIEQDPPQEVHSDRHLTNAADAEAYLAQLAAQSFPAEVNVQWHVHTAAVKDVARSIVDHAGEFGAGLVVMCSHGQGGVRDWLYGSIAQQVIAAGQTPALVLPPRDGRAGFAPHPLLVPLDGAPEHETGLPAAERLARATGAPIHLLMAIPTMTTLKWRDAAVGSLLPGSMHAALEMAEAGGREYLAGKMLALRKAGLTVSAEVARGDPAQVILSTAERLGAGVIVFGTHGKAGTGAFWAGSVTPQVAVRSPAALLLVPVGAPSKRV